jgi:nicotinate-nucleotide--dimethylbenzimidazole phosphoribosyltransferase
MANLDWVNNPIKNINEKYQHAAEQKQNSLTKPPGSLGRMEDIAVQMCVLQQTDSPQLKNIQIAVFAADHGIAAENVSLFPQVVTLEMVKNFARGGAAISVLANQLDARLEVINVGTVSAHEKMSGVVEQRIAPGTENFSKQAAMTQSQLLEALNAGKEAVLRAKDKSAQLFIGGDMGIANTTSATAIACAILNEKAEVLTGPGTGLDQNGVSRKAKVIEKSLQLHKEKMQTTLDILQCVGGFEIVALTGAYISSAQNHLPVVVDGFISSVAALAAIKINPAVRQWMFFSHASAEPGHAIIMQALQARPLLDMGMRLGEASGAAILVPLIKLACELHNNMATFEQAGVSNKD